MGPFRAACLAVLAALATLTLDSGGPARAQQSFSAFSCEELWFARNEIYSSAGYCFRTARAIRQFGNAGCRYDDVNDVPLSNTDRSTVRLIQSWEARRGCPR